LGTGEEVGDGKGAIVGWGTGMSVGAQVVPPLFDASSFEDEDEEESDTHLFKPSPPQKNAMAA